VSFEEQIMSKDKYLKIPKISPGAYFFSKELFEGLIFERDLYLEGLIIVGKFALQNWLGL